MADSQVHQKLAAILAADVAGYSRLMEADETATMSRTTMTNTTIAMRRYPLTRRFPLSWSETTAPGAGRTSAFGNP